MGGELGNETYIDLLLVYSALSPPIFILIENDNLYTNLVSKSWCFKVFADISARWSRKKKGLKFSYTFFFRTISGVSGLRSSNFCSPICSGSRDTTLGSFLRFMAGPARTYLRPYIPDVHHTKYISYLRDKTQPARNFTEHAAGHHMQQYSSSAVLQNASKHSCS